MVLSYQRFQGHLVASQSRLLCLQPAARPGERALQGRFQIPGYRRLVIGEHLSVYPFLLSCVWLPCRRCLCFFRLRWGLAPAGRGVGDVGLAEDKATAQFPQVVQPPA